MFRHRRERGQPLSRFFVSRGHTVPQEDTSHSLRLHPSLARLCWLTGEFLLEYAREYGQGRTCNTL